jgi:hypothetical protein
VLGFDSNIISYLDLEIGLKFTIFFNFRFFPYLKFNYHVYYSFECLGKLVSVVGCIDLIMEAGLLVETPFEKSSGDRLSK